MAQKIVQILDIGEVILSKRRGAKNLRLSVTGAGKVRVSLPMWIPYSAGIVFARQRAEWIKDQLKDQTALELKNGMKVGKLHSFYYIQDRTRKRITTVATNRVIRVTGPLPLGDKRTQKKAEAACEKALSAETHALLLPRLHSLAKSNGFRYKKADVRKLRSRWGSYSSSGVITLSIYLVQLPWQFIDYVLLHELVHTEHMDHSKDFWRRFTQVMPSARSMQKEMKLYKPRIQESIE